MNLLERNNYSWARGKKKNVGTFIVGSMVHSFIFNFDVRVKRLNVGTEESYGQQGYM